MTSIEHPLTPTHEVRVVCYRTSASKIISTRLNHEIASRKRVTFHLLLTSTGADGETEKPGDGGSDLREALRNNISDGASTGTDLQLAAMR